MSEIDLKVWHHVVEQPDLVLGNEHYFKFAHWRPDRTNRAHDHLHEARGTGAYIAHWSLTGKRCLVYITFDNVVMRAVHGPEKQHHTATSVIPLTISPEIRCTTCGDVGTVDAGQWRAV